MLHAGMARVTVRVTPRAGRTEVLAAGGEVRVRVRAAPAEGRATEEARRALADALGVPPSAIRLVTGERSRVKVFDVEGMDAHEVAMRLGAT
jgi:uncharacterized protein